MVCSCKSTMSVRIRSPPALNSWAPLSPQIRCVFLTKGHRSQAAPSLEQVSWVGSRKSRNFPSTQTAPRRLNDSCRSARDPVRSEKIPFFQAEQVSLCPTWRASQRATAYVAFSGEQSDFSPQPRNQRSIQAEQHSDTRGIVTFTLG